MTHRDLLALLAAGTMLAALGGCGGSAEPPANETAVDADETAPTEEQPASIPADLVEEVKVIGVSGPASRRYVAGQTIGLTPIRLGQGDRIELSVNGLVFRYSGPGLFTPGQVPPLRAADPLAPLDDVTDAPPSLVGEDGTGPGEPGFDGDTGSGEFSGGEGGEASDGGVLQEPPPDSPDDGGEGLIEP